MLQSSRYKIITKENIETRLR